MPITCVNSISERMNGSMAQSCQFTFFMTNESIYGLLFFFFGGFWKLIEIETVRKFPSVPMVENCCKGIFSQFYLKAYGEYVGLGIYFSKRIHFLKFISYQSFVGTVIFLESAQWIALKVDGKGVHRALALSTAPGNGLLDFQQSAWLLIALVRLWFNALFFFFFPVIFFKMCISHFLQIIARPSDFFSIFCSWWIWIREAMAEKNWKGSSFELWLLALFLLDPWISENFWDHL